MKPLMELFASYLGDQVETSLKRAVAPVGPYLRRLVFGAGLLFVGILALGGALFMLCLALFMHVAGYGNLVAASLWTSLPAAGIFLFFVLIGLLLLRRPR